MSYGSSETTRSVQEKKAGLVPLLRSSVEDAGSIGAHLLPFSFPVGAELFVAPPFSVGQSPATSHAHRRPLSFAGTRLATGLPFSERTPMRVHAPIFTEGR